MVSSFDFRLLIAATSQVPVGAATGAEEELVGADDRSVPAGAAAAAAAAAAATAATVSHEHKGAQSETSLHMRWAPIIVAPEHWLSKTCVQGRLVSQIWLASVQPPQWAVVPHVYLLHLSGGESGIPSAVAIRE